MYASTSEERYAVNAVDLPGVSAVTLFILTVLDLLIPLNKKNIGLKIIDLYSRSTV